MITLIHPSRSRPQQSHDTLYKWRSRAGVDVEVVVSLDQDDPMLEDYYITPGDTTLVNHNRKAIDAINRAARVAKGNIMIVVSDDTDCPVNWAKKILNATAGKEDFVVKVDDGIQRKMITMPILDKKYHNRFGYIYNPAYDHLFVDAEFSEVAYRLKKVIHVKAKFPHLHYSRTGQKPDAVHLKNEATYPQGKELFTQRKKIHFGL
jgi:hypothetical protein